MSPHSVLVVEDEPDVCELLRFTLSRAKFDIIVASTAEEALQILENRLPSIAVIDWMLPQMSGIELTKRIRTNPITEDLPILVLTARQEEKNKLEGFSSGADDYVTKPFSPKELIARIKALLRRIKITNETLNVLGIELDPIAKAVTVNGTPIHLRPTEYRLLEIFMRQPNRAFKRDQLLDLVWGRTAYVFERTVDVHVLRLRNALKPFKHDQLIKTVRSVGYRFDMREPES
ncbi:MAG: response regulator [Gammaproteobacteria bacterium]|nr:response regulator [Gammaproteobacteria bacterium]MYF53089.1 response regulator [Gammaproteobacteria bacterium]MYK44198.1 response regulator [Gammaproteobacteria bacterium]